jgi:Ca2+-binding EF-hand superfamily protein
MQSNLVLKLLAVAALAGVAGGAAEAREPGMPRSERIFERLDVNKDGELAVDELGARSERRFMRLDADRNGKVTRAELEDWLNRLAARRIDRIIEQMDADKDAAVSQDELHGYIAGLVLAADTDKSGGVTLQEARDYHAAKRNARAEARKAASATRQ